MLAYGIKLTSAESGSPASIGDDARDHDADPDRHLWWVSASFRNRRRPVTRVVGCQGSVKLVIAPSASTSTNWLGPCVQIAAAAETTARNSGLSFAAGKDGIKTTPGC